MALSFIVYHNLAAIVLSDIVRIVLFVFTIVFANNYYSHINNYEYYYCKEVYDREFSGYDCYQLKCVVLLNLDEEETIFKEALQFSILSN